MNIAQELRLKLATLFPDPASIRPIAHDAGLNLGDIDFRGGANQVWFNVLEYASARGRSRALLDVLMEMEPTLGAPAETFLATEAEGKLVTDLPSSYSAEGQVAIAVAGLGAVEQVLGSDEVGAAFRASKEELDGVVARIDLLKTYKSIHDLLQRFQFPVVDFQRLKRAARAVDEPEKRQIVREFLISLGPLHKVVKDHVNQLPEGDLRDQELSWVDALKASLGRLDQGIRDRAPQAIIVALNEIRTPLKFVPARINEHIFRTAKNLPLNGLVETLGRTAAVLPENHASAGTITAARDAVLVLTTLVLSRVVEHKLWQDFDGKLADLTDAVESNDPDRIWIFAALWLDLKPRLKVLAELDPNGNWQPSVDGYAGQIDEILPSKDAELELDSAFRDFRDEALSHFVDVDIALKNECGSMVKISQPLHAILGKLEP